MHLLASLSAETWQVLSWLLLGLVAVTGLLALVSPRTFSSMAHKGSRWVDTERLFAILDKRYDVDRHVLPFSRVLGGLVLASVAVLAWLLAIR